MQVVLKLYFSTMWIFIFSVLSLTSIFCIKIYAKNTNLPQLPSEDLIKNFIKLIGFILPMTIFVVSGPLLTCRSVDHFIFMLLKVHRENTRFSYWEIIKFEMMLLAEMKGYERHSEWYFYVIKYCLCYFWIQSCLPMLGTTP